MGAPRRHRWPRYRELAGHDDPTDALGPAPKPGQVEAYAAYRAAWRTLGRPEVDREELELSDGQLRVRVRAYERESPGHPATSATNWPAPARPPPPSARPESASSVS